MHVRQRAGASLDCCTAPVFVENSVSYLYCSGEQHFLSSEPLAMERRRRSTRKFLVSLLLILFTPSMELLWSHRFLWFH